MAGDAGSGRTTDPTVFLGMGVVGKCTSLLAKESGNMFLYVRRNQLTLRGRHPLSRPIQDVLGAVLKIRTSQKYATVPNGTIMRF